MLYNSKGYPMSIAVKVSIILLLCLRGRPKLDIIRLQKLRPSSSPLYLQLQTFRTRLRKTFDDNMGVKTWLKKHSIWPSRSSSSLSSRQPDAVNSADAQCDQRHLQESVANVELDTASSTVPQIKANETIERSETIQPSATSSTFDNTPIRELWNVAYEKLREEEGALVAEYEAKLQGSVVAGLGEALKLKTNTRERMWAILQSKMNEVNQNTTKFNIGSTEVIMRDVAQLVLNVVGAANSYISQAVSANPAASIAWTGVSFLLPVSQDTPLIHYAMEYNDNQ